MDNVLDIIEVFSNPLKDTDSINFIYFYIFNEVAKAVDVSP